MKYKEIKKCSEKLEEMLDQYVFEDFEDVMNLYDILHLTLKGWLRRYLIAKNTPKEILSEEDRRI